MFVTKLAAEMFRRGFKKLPKMLPRSFQDAPKVVMVSQKSQKVIETDWSAG